jgi:hypothetical protein
MILPGTSLIIFNFFFNEAPMLAFLDRPINAGGASWREGDRYRKVYLGSCRKMSPPEALQNARRIKAEALGYGKEGIERHV